MRVVMTLLLVLMAWPVSAQAPTREHAAMLLRDARDELIAAQRALEASDVWQRYQRAKRNAEDRAAQAEKAAKAEKPETGSK
jgi:hypothetical protein